MTTTRVSLREQALAAAASAAAANEQALAAKIAETQRRELCELRDALKQLGVVDDVEVSQHEIDAGDYRMVELRAAVDGLVFSVRDDPYSTLHVLAPCARKCGKDLWVPAVTMEQLGRALADEQTHYFACLQKFDEHGEATTDAQGNPLPPGAPKSGAVRLSASERLVEAIRDLVREAVE